MDRSKVRIGLISLGIIAGLILILYLPVLIWSPPWGLPGIYTWTIDNDHTEVRIISGNQMEFITIHENEWIPLNDIREFSEKGGLYHMDNVKMEVRSGWIKFEPDINTDVKFIKMTNPFILWYIKWLEWTND